MNDSPILDHFTEKTPWQVEPKTQRAFQWIELALWLAGLLGFLAKITGQSGGPEIMIIGLGLLGFYYLLFPIFLFRSVGWKRHVGAHLIGFALFCSVLAIVFAVLHWNGAIEQVRNGLKTTALASIFTLIFYFLPSQRPNGKQFYRGILFRIIPLLFLMGWLMEVVGQR